MALDMIWYGMVWYHTYHDVAPEAKADPSVGTGRHVLDLGEQRSIVLWYHHTIAYHLYCT